MSDRGIREEELKALLAAEIGAATLGDAQELSERRAKALEYYRSEMSDTPTMVNRSSVVSGDVADTIGRMPPGMIRIYAASDRMAEYEPVRPGDEAFSRQATDYVNHIFWKGETTGAFAINRGLAAEDVRAAAAPSRRSAPRVRAGATEPGLPGGPGVWGRLLPADTAPLPAPPAAGTVVLWHRAARPDSFDAAGLSDHEIQATLEAALEAGHDGVMIKNHTRPGSKTPETVIVVRDQNQLRSPAAKFDPAKIGSRNLLASLAAIPGVSVMALGNDYGEE